MSAESVVKDGLEVKLFCPENGCLFSRESGRFFKKKMLLDQHRANCHEEKRFVCSLCSKAYAIGWQLKHHQKTCGLEWKCLSCDKVYAERLSLITHCKRHGHLLPSNAKLRKSPKSHLQPRCNVGQVQVVLLPIIISPAVGAFNNQTTQRHILPKVSTFGLNCSPGDDRLKPQTSTSSTPVGAKDCSTQTEGDPNKKQEKTCSCGSSSAQQEASAGVSNIDHEISCFTTRAAFRSQSGTQTEREPKGIASIGAQCPPIRRKSKKRKVEHDYESTETQTMESILSHQTSRKTTRTTSTVISPPRKSKKRSVGVETVLHTFDDKDLLESPLVNTSNPLLSQFNNKIVTYSSTSVGPEEAVPRITEQSVQTEEDNSGVYFSLTHCNTIETQTCDEFGTDLLSLDGNTVTLDENYFLELNINMNDIETQTIWNNDSTTQTEDFSGIDVDVVLKDIFGDESDDDSAAGQGQSTMTSNETQTQIDLSHFISSFVGNNNI